MSDFDVFDAIRRMDGPVEPPEGFAEELYTAVRARLDEVAVGAVPEEQTAPRRERRYLPAFAVAVVTVAFVAAMLSLAPGGEDSPAAEAPNLALPDPPSVTHNPDPNVIGPGGQGDGPTVLRTFAHPDAPFELLVVGPTSDRATIFDLPASVAYVYEAGEHALPRNGIDAVTPFGEQWLVFADEKLWRYEADIAVSPTIFSEMSGVIGNVDGGAIHYAEGASSLWVEARSSSGLTSGSRFVEVDMATGIVARTVGVVTGSEGAHLGPGGLMINDPVGIMALVSSEHGVEPGWPGTGVVAGDDALIWLDCSGGGEGGCVLRETKYLHVDRSLQRGDDLTAVDLGLIGDPIEAVRLLAPSPDLERVAWAARIGDRTNELRIIDLETGDVSVLGQYEISDTRAGPEITWSADGEWLFVLGKSPLAIEVATGEFFDLREWIISDGLVYGIGLHP